LEEERKDNKRKTDAVEERKKGKAGRRKGRIYKKIQAREKCSNAVKDQLRSINLTSF
jgi:hypothetical protein